MGAGYFGAWSHMQLASLQQQDPCHPITSHSPFVPIVPIRIMDLYGSAVHFGLLVPIQVSSNSVSRFYDLVHHRVVRKRFCGLSDQCVGVASVSVGTLYVAFYST